MLCDETIKWWGSGNKGQLGNGSTNDENTPVSESNITNATAGADSGSQRKYPRKSQTCALVSNGTIKCWGSGAKGQLGNGSTNDQNTPVSVSNITNATAISAGGEHSCALLSDGTIT